MVVVGEILLLLLLSSAEQEALFGRLFAAVTEHHARCMHPPPFPSSSFKFGKNSNLFLNFYLLSPFFYPML